MSNASTVRSGVDTFVASGKANKNYARSKNIRVSRDDRIGYSLFKSPAPKGATILSAELVYYQEGNFTGNVELEVRLTASAWSEKQITWGNRPGPAGPSTTTSKSNPRGNAEWSFDVTEHVQLIANGTVNRGFQIRSNHGANLDLRSGNATTKRPYLRVVWTRAPQAPTRIKPSFGMTSTSKPVVSCDFTDRIGSTRMTAMHVQIAEASNFVGAQGFQIETDTPQMNLAETAFVHPGGTVWMRIRVRDGANLWSQWSDPVTWSYLAKGSVDINSPSAQDWRTNHVTKPSYENGSSAGWAYRSGVTGWTTSVVAGGRKGGKVLRLLAAAGATKLGWQHTITGLTPGNRYDALTDIRIPLADAKARLEIQWQTTAGVNVGAPVLGPMETLTAGTMNGLQHRLTAPATATRAVMTVAVDSVPFTDMWVWLDGHGLIDTYDNSEPYWFEGALPAYDNFTHRWLGTAEASKSVQTRYIVGEFTPPITWQFTGAGLTQTAYQVVIATDANPTRAIHDTGKRAGGIAAYTVPKGILKSNVVYRVTVRVWDQHTTREGTVGDPPYVGTWRRFRVAPGEGDDTVSDFTATQVGETPLVLLKWKRSTAPDFFVIMRDGVVIEDEVLPSRVDTGDSTYQWIDVGAQPSVQHTYKVRPEVDNELLASPNALVTPKVIGIYVIDPDDKSWVVLGGKDYTVTADDRAESYPVLGSAEIVRSVMAVTGRVGTVQNLLLRTRNGHSWQTFDRRMNLYKGRPSDEFRLVIGEDNMPVVLGNVVVHAHPDSKPDQVLRSVSFAFWQTGEHDFNATY